MIGGIELFQTIHDQQDRYDAKLHIAEMIALLSPPHPGVMQRYQYMREYPWPESVRREDDRLCETAEEYFCGPFFDNDGIFNTQTNYFQAQTHKNLRLLSLRRLDP